MKKYYLKELSKLGHTEYDGVNLEHLPTEELQELFFLYRQERKPIFGFIYAIGCAERNLVKIGFSKNPKKRLKEIQTYCPFQVKLFKTIPGTLQQEKEFHKKFKNLSLKGEWFHLTNEIISNFLIINKV